MDLFEDPVTAVSVDPNGRVMAINALSRDVRLWDVGEFGRRAVHRELADPLRLEQPVVRVLAFSPGGKMLATAYSGQVVLWSLAEPRDPRRVGVVDAAASAMVFADGGRTLLLSDPNAVLAVWDVTDPSRPKRAGGPPPGGGHQRVAFAPDGGLLATADDAGGVVLWDLTDRDRPRQLGPALQDGTEVVALAFAGDGQSLATATGDGATRLWDLHGLHDIRRDAVQTACAIAGSGLTADEWTRYVSGLDPVDSCAS